MNEWKKVLTEEPLVSLKRENSLNDIYILIVSLQFYAKKHICTRGGNNCEQGLDTWQNLQLSMITTVTYSTFKEVKL